MDADAFLMAFRRFVSRRGIPKELFSDCGTNFKNLSSTLPVHHILEESGKEKSTVKNAIKCCLKDRVITEVVLQTVIIEAEGLMNSKPLGYVTSDIADRNPVTLNMLLMRRRDPPLPSIVFGSEEIRSRKL
ncbi:uncharacterized protein LOC102804030 [Saccoglossus kowalevskii]|uniref:Uncharacterized protein LOC102804030 n=1 Tax=Saccoglossus kowalevskii TaxID=10224 RepID=A0ABM0LXV8_SACKO|nr:PREDICTED: uncharacterized protein LOC102804030 [Saccoglossus kowalevskii]